MNPRRFVLLSLSTVLLACRSEPPYDVVISNGRVMDPESGLDSVRNIGIRGGRIEMISAEELNGTRVIDANGLVVAPGFIDLHEHGQQEESYSLMVRDGVTSALELEVGTSAVAPWYAAREAGQIVNYGVSVGHMQVRIKVFNDPGKGIAPVGVGASAAATEAQMAEMEDMFRKGLEEGAVAVGLGSAYTPGATMEEIERVFRVAAQGGASAHIHMRNGVAGLDSTIAAAKSARRLPRTHPGRA
jgi:N-acyl-D-aspartate/D-glutamate deacylase